VVTTTTAPPPCGLDDTMPDLVGLTMGQVDAYLGGNPKTTEGVSRHYMIVPPPGSNGPWTLNDIVASEDPAPGTCNASSLASTLYLAYP
jgi:hypothetical protein